MSEVVHVHPPYVEPEAVALVVPTVKTLEEAMYHAGLVRPRIKPEVDLAPYAFYPDDFFMRFFLWPKNVDLFPPRREAPRIVMPDGVTPFDLNPRLILP